MLGETLQEQYLFIKAFEDAPIGMALVSIDGHFLKVNSSMCKILGYSEQELYSLTIHSVTYPDDLEENLGLRRRAIAGEINSYRIEKRYIHHSGEIIWGLLSVTIQRDEQGKIVFFISQLVDITEQKMREEKIKETEKLSLVGELAAGIAHEIRNPLTSLRGFVQLLRSSKKMDHAQKYFEIMASEIDRINEIVSELLVLAKPSNESFAPRSIAEQLEHVVTLLQAEANLRNIIIRIDMEPDLPYINSQSSLKQVFINILKNAIESMPAGGEVILEAKALEKEVCIRVIDQGCGIPQNQLKKVWKPFFTTKEDGTGLGLMVSQRIIQNHKGTICIQSEIGKGTIIEISFPVYKSLKEK